eukprot:1495294-Rhodomonas_salina.1
MMWENGRQMLGSCSMAMSYCSGLKGARRKKQGRGAEKEDRRRREDSVWVSAGARSHGLEDEGVVLLGLDSRPAHQRARGAVLVAGAHERPLPPHIAHKRPGRSARERSGKRSAQARRESWEE